MNSFSKNISHCFFVVLTVVVVNSETVYADSDPVGLKEDSPFKLPADFDQIVEKALIGFEIPGVAIGIVAK